MLKSAFFLALLTTSACGQRDPSATESTSLARIGGSLPAQPAAQASTAAVAAQPKLAELPLTVPSDQLRVALFGDMGTGAPAQTLMQSLRRLGVQLVVIAGDFDYADDPAAWEAVVKQLEPVPVLAVLGNHDMPKAAGYLPLIASAEARLGADACHGEPGRNHSCQLATLRLVLSEIGTNGDNAASEAFIQRELEVAKEPWKLCVWHKNQRDMQVGRKADEVGWSAYRSCAAHGALVVTGHEHSYSRTRTLTALGDRAVGHGAIGPWNALELGPGRTGVIVAGLGGIGIRDFSTQLHATDTWWAAYLTADRERLNGVERAAAHSADLGGALILDLPRDAATKQARGWFISGPKQRVFDAFSLERAP